MNVPNPARLALTSRLWRFHDAVSMDHADVIPGNAAAQHYTVQPIEHHIGVSLRCRRCVRIFAFPASEQQHWYETLGFWVDSVPVECRACRTATRAVKGLNARLSEVLARSPKQLAEFDEIVDIAQGLIDHRIRIGRRLATVIRMAAKRSGHPASRMVLERVTLF